MKSIFNIILSILILNGCSSTDRNTRIIEGSWQVASLSERPLTITNYGDGRLDSASLLTFGSDGVLKIFQSGSTKTFEVFRYKIDNDELIIFCSDYGIPFQIEIIASNRLELKASGYGNTLELRAKVHRIELIKKMN